jgi:hypothetical protein
MTTKIPRIINPSSDGPKKGDKAPSDPDPDQVMQNFLLKDLKPEDFVMETPTAAFFTLFIGIIC